MAKDVVRAAGDAGLKRDEPFMIRGVVSYGADYEDHWRRAWEMVVKMLKGARPEDTPVDRDTRFILTVDPKGAREIGIEIPASIMIRANVLVQ